MTPDKLRELCMLATPGPWTRSLVHQYDQTLTYIENENDESIVIETSSGIDLRNSRFICAANPQTVLGLLDKLDIAVEALASLYDDDLSCIDHDKIISAAISRINGGEVG